MFFDAKSYIIQSGSQNFQKTIFDITNFLYNNKNETIICKPSNTTTYKKQDIAMALDYINISRTIHNPLVVIFYNSELFTSTIGNSLLCLLESIPPFTAIILCTTAIRLMLPTIVSRSIIMTVNEQEEHDDFFLSFFTDKKTTPLQIKEYLANNKWSHEQSIRLMQTILLTMTQKNPPSWKIKEIKELLKIYHLQDTIVHIWQIAHQIYHYQ